MKDFGKANGANKIISNVAKANQNANVVTVKMISNDKLHDYPRNNEDLTHTEDLETSIHQLGFTEPIDVTDFGMPDGEYTIVSGHRRRVAGAKLGMTSFPCIVRSFKSDSDMHNFVLMLNSQRDSSKDPLLYAKRYKMHEQYLEENNFTGSIREEVAKRLGISVQQADRYKQFTRVILPVWDMVSAEIVGMSSVLPMATHTPEEQEEILRILNESLNQNVSLTRPVCDKIIKGYRDGKKTYAEIFEARIENEPHEDTPILQTPPQNNIVNLPQAEQQQPQAIEDEKENPMPPTDIVNPIPQPPKPPIETLNNHPVIDNKDNTPAPEPHEQTELTEDEKEKQQELERGKEVSKTLSHLESLLNEYYAFEDKATATVIMKEMSGMIEKLYDEIGTINDDYKADDVFGTEVEKIKEYINRF